MGFICVLQHGNGRRDSVRLMLTREGCEALDASDPLRSLRDHFELPSDVIYLDGNSLGPPPRIVRGRISEVMDGWATDLISGWWSQDWLGLPEMVGRRLEPLLGAEPGSVVCADSTSVNLFKVVEAACRLAEGDILTDSGNFPTDLYVLRAVAERDGRRLLVVDPESLSDAITDSIGVTAATHVDFRTGRLHDLAAITERAHNFGGLAIWDLSHSAGAMEIGLTENRVDLAVGCGYKFLNGGPGAPAYLYVAPHLQPHLANPITGWFGHADPFDFSRDFVPAEGIGRMKVGTPAVLSMAALETALSVFEDVELGSVRAKSVALTSLFIDLIDQELGEEFEIVTPRSADQRGSQVSLRRMGAEALAMELGRAGVICDFRPPDLTRFGFGPLFVRYSDVCDAVSRIKKVI
jgi:kynureninase